MNRFGIYDLNEYLDFKTRLEIYKHVGFDDVALYIDNGYMKAGEDYHDIIAYARQIGLKVCQVHVDYKISNEICSKDSEKYFEYLEAKLTECTSLKIPYLVLHASKGDNPPLIDASQIKKLESLAKKFPSVTLCFENVRSNQNLDRILKSKQNNIRMCFDLGHAHAYGDEYEIFEKYKEKIACSHLHNNFGTDAHSPLWDGEINWKYFAKELCKIPKVSNCLECFPERKADYSIEEFTDFVKKCFKTIEEIKDERKIMIETERLFLREWKMDDLDDLIEGLGNVNVAKNLTVPFPYTEKEGKEFLNRCAKQDKNSIHLAIVLKESGKVIGGTSIEILPDGKGKGGIWFNEKHTSKGYGTEAWKARAGYAFEILGLKVLENGFFDFNKASAHMQEKVGFKIIGEKMNFSPALGKEVREVVTRLTSEEFYENYNNFLQWNG